MNGKLPDDINCVSVGEDDMKLGVEVLEQVKLCGPLLL